jgi:parvulin-like peptidyl-prolyl isomerase
MRRNAVIFLVIALFLLVSAGCDNFNLLNLGGKSALGNKFASTPKVKGTVIAKVNNMPITLEELNEEVDVFNSLVPSNRPELKITTREKKIDYLKNEMIQRALFYQEALRRGLDKKDVAQRAIEKSRMNILTSVMVEEEIDKLDVTSKEIEDFYNSSKDQLKEPEERQIREIMVSTDQEARDILIQLLQGGDFAAIAKEKSKAPSAKDGGDIGFIKKEGRFNQYIDVAFSDTLEVGKTSSIFKGPKGYYIIKLEAIRGGKQKSLSDLWDDIKQRLLYLKRQRKLEDLLSKLSREAKSIDILEGEIR